MKIVEITNALKSLGWSLSRDEVGDRLASYRLSDRTADIIYGLKRLPDKQQLWVMRSTSTDAFSSACAKVDPGYGISAPLVTPWNNPDIRVPEILEEHVRQASDEAIAWAKAQDLDKALREHAALPTNAPGARPIWHLAALALLGDVAKLKSYQASFAAGDRLGFVNYITKDYIDRAVALAEQTASG
ncbi:MAG TPA: hypothetical protein PKC09_02625 [Paracoccus sp. (in: a-proteobacteria)]|uniref:DUF6990 domain-containing protein n=1 Tax=uncultured Paracoccus sp. TaxID=189685 RepID=UPI00261C1EC2|nr:hypothetical protein [uncultured Paracoccus sp.]HMQ40145.1 hypothetical protein [Paracoccus sp. (in: a-proteobacteria)]HMR35117.1 hypothetical protein [Paracoccus sp. (in: a-proteobacteria)]